MGGYLLEDVLCACEGGGCVCGRGGDRCLKFIKLLAIALNTILSLKVHKALNDFQLSCILSDPRKHHTFNAVVVPACLQPHKQKS